MCKYCKNVSCDPFSMELGDLILCTPAKYTYYGDGQEYSVPFNFCPYCGKRLEWFRRKESCHEKEHPV